MVAGNQFYLIYLRRAMHLFTPATLHIHKHITANVICHILIYTCVQYTFLMCKHIKMYTFLCEHTSATEHVHPYIYIYMYIYIYTYIYIYLYTSQLGTNPQRKLRRQHHQLHLLHPCKQQRTLRWALLKATVRLCEKASTLNLKPHALNLSRKFAQNCFLRARFSEY